jgi:hypothetical protein
MLAVTASTSCTVCWKKKILPLTSLGVLVMIPSDAFVLQRCSSSISFLHFTGSPSCQYLSPQSHHTRPFYNNNNNNNNNSVQSCRSIHHDVSPKKPSTTFLDDIAECWEATSWTVNPQDREDINVLLRCFNSPAPQAYHAFQRALDQSDDVFDVLQIFSYLLKKDCQFEIEDTLYYDYVQSIDNGRRRRWRIVSTSSTDFAVYTPTTENASSQNNSPVVMWQSVRLDSEFPHTLSIAHRLLDLVVDMSQSWHVDCSFEQLRTTTDEQRFLEDLAFHRLHLALGVDIRGRSAADTAFTLAVAGVTRPELYEILTMISYQELKRIGPRPSFPSKHILQIVEKIAAAGIGEEYGRDAANSTASKLFALAAALLGSKSDNTHHMDIIQALRAAAKTEQRQGGENSIPPFGLHSTWPLLWLWRFAAQHLWKRGVGGSRLSYKLDTYQRCTRAHYGWLDCQFCGPVSPSCCGYWLWNGSESFGTFNVTGCTLA